MKRVEISHNKVNTYKCNGAYLEHTTVENPKAQPCVLQRLNYVSQHDANGHIWLTDSELEILWTVLDAWHNDKAS